MTPKSVIRVLLLILAVGAMSYVVSRPWWAGAASSAPEPIDARAEVLVYYFSMGKECATCDQIEAWTRETVERAFAEELASGRVVWRKIDLDAPGNSHYASDYDLFTKSVVVARLAHGVEVHWTNLRDVWNLVGNRPAFEHYIRSEVQAALDETP